MTPLDLSEADWADRRETQAKEDMRERFTPTPPQQQIDDLTRECIRLIASNAELDRQLSAARSALAAVREVRQKQLAPDDDRRFPNAADGEAQNDWLNSRDMLDKEKEHLDARDF